MLVFGFAMVADHDLAAARPGLDARAFAQPRRSKARVRRVETATEERRSWQSIISACASAASSPSTSCRFSAKRGDITALIGPNGAGKTTVFNCITGFYKPSAGMIRLAHPDGKAYLLERLLDFRIAKLARVARTFQNIRLFAGMTALENLIVAQHNVMMRASGLTFAGLLGLPSYAARRARRDRQGALLARPHRPHAPAPTTWPARWPTASSAASRSRAPCAPIRCCSASTSPPPASTRARAASSTSYCCSSARSTAPRSC